MRKIQEITKIYCWYCGKEIKHKNRGRGFDDTDGFSSHHFFNYNDIKYRLLRLFGEPKDDKAHIIRQLMIKMVFDNMTKFPVHTKCHKEIEGKLK